MSVPGTYVAGDVLNAAEMNALPGGFLGHAQAVANQASIGVGPTDVTSLSIGVTVAASRRIKVTAKFVTSQQTSIAIQTMRIQEGGTELQRSVSSPGVGEFVSTLLVAFLTPSAGAHTYKLTAGTSAGTMTVEAAATYPAFILVEDIGPA